MDFGLYVLSVVLTLGFGFLTYQDRLFGVAGILTGFSMGAFLYTQQTIVYNSVYSDSTTTTILPHIIILFIVTILDIAILLDVQRRNKETIGSQQSWYVNY